MDKAEGLASREWILIGIFFAILVSFVSIACISDRKTDKEIEQYIDSSSSKQTF